MVIYFFVDSFPKLSETFILRQITGLIDRGYEVRIVAMEQGGDAEIQPDINRYALFERLIIIPISKDLRVLIPKCIGFYARRLNKVSFRTLFSRFGLIMFLYAPFLAELDIRPDDIAICNFGPNGIKASNLIRFGKQFRIITIFHGYDLSSFLRGKGKTVYRDVFTNSNLIVPISDFWKQKLIDLGCAEERIVTMRMGVDGDEFKSSEQDHEGFTFVSVGRLIEKKGFEYSVRAFAEALPKLPDNVRYIIVGDGPLKIELQTTIDRLGIAERVRLVGSKNSSEVRDLLQNCDVFIMPSVTSKDGDMEGIPVSMLEAQSAGLPVIATRHSGLSEGLIEGLTGLLVNEKQQTELADAIVEAANWSKSDLLNKGRTARAFIDEHYNGPKQLEAFASLVDMTASN